MVEWHIRDLEDEFFNGDSGMTANDFGRMMTRLEAKRSELAALPQSPEQTIYEPSDQTVAEHWW